MIDIHAHILPGVDDGSRDLLDSVLMAELALESGVDTVFATPHSHVPQESMEEHLVHIERSFRTLEKELRDRNLPLRLVPGMEIFCTPELEEFMKNRLVLPLGNSPCWLIEFRFSEDAATCRRYIETVRSLGGWPVIAHPERYDCVQRDIGEAAQWVLMGALLQVNRGSVFGRFGRPAKKTALRLLSERMAAFAASDAHSPYRRTTHMEDMRQFLSETYSPKEAERLLVKNPRKLLAGI